jgi:hypothetical protein
MQSAAEISSSTGVQCRVNEIVSELHGYISAGFLSIDRVASLLRQEGTTTSSVPCTKNLDAAKEQPSVGEANVSACSI